MRSKKAVKHGTLPPPSKNIRCIDYHYSINMRTCAFIKSSTYECVFKNRLLLTIFRNYIYLKHWSIYFMWVRPEYFEMLSLEIERVFFFSPIFFYFCLPSTYLLSALLCFLMFDVCHLWCYTKPHTMYASINCCFVRSKYY